jgi:hypothetical protein
MENINENNKELENVQQEPEVLSELDMNLKIPSSKFLAQYLENNTLESDTSTLIDRTPTDLKSYLSLYARGQLKRIEKLTEYLDKMEDKLLNDMERYEDKEFLRAIQLIQQSLSSSVELVKMIGTDDNYLNIFYQENHINGNTENPATPQNPVANILSKDSREKLRQLLNKIKIQENQNKEDTK